MHGQCLLRSPRLHCRVYHFPSLQSLLHCDPFMSTSIVTRQAEMEGLSPAHDITLLGIMRPHGNPYHARGVPGVSA